MAIEVLDQGESFLLLRSTETRATYVVRLTVTRKGEELQATSLSAILDGGSRALGVGDREQVQAVSPAGREANVVHRAGPGETSRVVRKALRDKWQDGKEITAATGLGETQVKSALVVLHKNGEADMKQAPRNPQYPDGLKKNLYRVAQKQRDRRPQGMSPADQGWAEKITAELSRGDEMSTADLNLALGLERQATILYDALRAMNHRGMIRIREDKYVDDNNITRKRRMYSLPQENAPSGPSSQRDSSLQGSSNRGL